MRTSVPRSSVSTSAVVSALAGATPLLSLLTIPAIAGGAYPALLLSAAGADAGLPGAASALEAIARATNEGVILLAGLAGLPRADR